MTRPDLDEVPPWHAYCGCHACRRAYAITRRWDPPPKPPDEVTP